MASAEAFQKRLLRTLGREAVTYVRPKIRSYKGKPIRVLQRSLRAVVVDNSVVLHIPFYWAVYVHDGRKGPVTPKSSPFLIWWKNPRLDPRLRSSGGHSPKKESQVKRLSPAQFDDALRIHREAIAAGRESPIVITTSVRKRTPPSRFFGNGAGEGMFGFKERAEAVARREFRSHLLTSLRKQLGVTSFIPSGAEINAKPIVDLIDLRI